MRAALQGQRHALKAQPALSWELLTQQPGVSASRAPQLQRKPGSELPLNASHGAGSWFLPEQPWPSNHRTR